MSQVHHRRIGAIDDELVFARAQGDERTVVTDNIADFEPLVSEYEQRQSAHHGVVYCSSRQFDRADPRTTGRMVDALDGFIRAHANLAEPFNGRHWLLRAERH